MAPPGPRARLEPRAQSAGEHATDEISKFNFVSFARLESDYNLIRSLIIDSPLY